MSEYSLKVLKKIKEAADVVSIQLEVLKPLEDLFLYQPGQFIGLRAQINGEKIGRSYSLSSSPQDPFLQITLKKLPEGKMSSYLVDHVQEGDSLIVTPPEGQFLVHGDQRHHIMFAAGSGIAPILSMIQSILQEQKPYSSEKRSKVTLFYSNKSEEHIIFKSLLLDLQKSFEEFRIYWSFTQKKPTDTQMYKVYTLGKEGKKEPSVFLGRIDKKFLKRHFLLWQSLLEPIFYLCGPEDFMDFIQSFLGFNGYDHMQIRKESFGPKNPENSNNEEDIVFVVGTDGQVKRSDISCEDSQEVCEKILAEIDFENCEVTPNVEESILEALLREGFDPPYSCLDGHCLTCQCVIKEGAIRMRDTGMLNEEDYASGRALSCQAIPLTNKVKVQYEF